MARSGDSTEGSRSIRVLEVAEAVVSADRPMTVSELARETGLPRGSLHRVVSLLQNQGFIEFQPGAGRRMIGGKRLLRLARRTLAASGEQSHRHAVLASVSREIGETCNVSMPDGDAMLYFDRVETEWPLRHQLPVGSRVPLHCTASGKLYLSRLSRKDLTKLLSVLPLDRRTAKTMTDPAVLSAALAKIRAEGVGIDDEEFIEGMVAIAVPVTDFKGRMIAALAFHAPTLRITLADARGHLPLLWRAADALSENE